MCRCAYVCGQKNRCACACAAHFQNVCDVHAGADENPRTLKGCIHVTKGQSTLMN